MTGGEATEQVAGFGLVVRFELRPGHEAAFDALVERTLAGIRAQEPGTSVYVSHAVEGAPLQRIFYELYESRAAFDEHERQPHVRRFLAEREQHVASVEVDVLTAIAGKAAGNPRRHADPAS